MIAIQESPQITFKIGNGQTKNDHVWLKKKKEYLEKMWIRNGSKIIQKIEDTCGDTFTGPSKQKGILVLLYKKSPQDREGFLSEDNPLEINLFLSKNDTTNIVRELLLRMLVHSFIQQQYEFRFRISEQALFEDILVDEFLTSMVSLTVLGRKLSRLNCSKALDRAIEETVFRLSQKKARNKLLDALCKFYQAGKGKSKRKQMDILIDREELIEMLLEFLPINVKD